MFASPSPSKKPSERTVEVLANHYLLHGINKARCWLFCPSTNEEFTHGFDGSAQNVKTIILQYKAVTYASPTVVSVPIDLVQFGTLLINFPKANWPYVFYAFSLHRNYQEIDSGYKAKNCPTFFENCIFVDIHDLPPGTTRLRYSFATGSVSPIVSGAAKSPIPFLRGPQFLCGITSCSIGSRREHGNKRAVPIHDSIERDSFSTSGLSVLQVPIG